MPKKIELFKNDEAINIIIRDLVSRADKLIGLKVLLIQCQNLHSKNCWAPKQELGEGAELLSDTATLLIRLKTHWQGDKEDKNEW